MNEKTKVAAAWADLTRLISEATEDVDKASCGNRAAAVRARKKMQEIKAAAQDVRNTIQELVKRKQPAGRT